MTSKAEMLARGQRISPPLFFDLMQRTSDIESDIPDLSACLTAMLVREFGPDAAGVTFTTEIFNYGDKPSMQPKADETASPAPMHLDEADLLAEVKKRQLINKLIQGGAALASYTADYEADKNLAPLSKHYRDLMASGLAQQEMAKALFPTLSHAVSSIPPAGLVEIDQSSGETLIKAAGMNGGILYHEMAKGLLEAAGRWGMPGALDDHDTPDMIQNYNAAMRAEVLHRADRVEDELDGLTNGVDLWVQCFGDKITPDTLRQFQQFVVTPAHEIHLAFMINRNTHPNAPDVRPG